MPLNSYKCKECGKRNNYVISLDELGSQIVECSVCGFQEEISYEDLPERVQETIDDLHRDAKIFADDGETSDALSTEDTVDETLCEVEKRFDEARAEMSVFDKIVRFDNPITEIASEYISDEVSSKLDGYAKDVLDEDGNLRADWKHTSFESALSEASEHLDSDGFTARIISYIQQAMQSGAGIDMLLDTEAMKAFGLKKKERFILKQAAKSGKISSILKQMLNEESF